MSTVNPLAADAATRIHEFLEHRPSDSPLVAHVMGDNHHRAGFDLTVEDLRMLVDAVIDTVSSGSRQGYIETGRYSTHAEEAELNPKKPQLVIGAQYRVISDRPCGADLRMGDVVVFTGFDRDGDIMVLDDGVTWWVKRHNLGVI